MNTELFTVNELSEILNIKPVTIRSTIERKKIKFKGKVLIGCNYNNLYDFKEIKKAVNPKIKVIERYIYKEIIKTEIETYHIYESKMNYDTN